MKRYLSLLIIAEDKILIRKRRFGKHNSWTFIEKIIKYKESQPTDFIYFHKILNTLNLKATNNEIARLGVQEYEETGKLEEFWMVKLKDTPKIKSLFYKYVWVGKEDAKERTRNYGPDVFYYIQKYFELC